MKLIDFLKKVAIAASIVAMPASAATLGMADLQISGLVILNAQGQPVTTGINITSESRTGTAASNYNGIDGAGIGNSTQTSTNLNGPAPNNGQIDVKYRCAGPSCGSAGLTALYSGNLENNNTTHVTSTALTYAVGDMQVFGSGIQAAGASGLTRADSAVESPDGLSSANATIANSVTSITQFTVSNTLQARFSLGYNAFVKAFVDALAPNTKGAALGTISWVLTLSEVGVALPIMEFKPSEVNRGLTSGHAGQNQEYSSSSAINGNVLSDFVTLTSGREYTLAINQASNSLAAEIVDIPEPGSMLLVALGLFALGAVSRRSRS